MPVTSTTDPNSLLQIARQKQVSGDIAGALQIYNGLRPHFPKNTGLLNICGQLEMQLGHGKPAAQLFIQSLQIKPDQVEIWYACGVVWNSMHGYEQARRCFTQALALDESHVRALTMRAVAHSAQGHMKEALRDCTQAMKLKPDAEAFYNRGTIYLRMERAAAALSDFDKALGLAPGHTNARINRGIARLGLGQPAEALLDFDLAIRDDPKNIAARHERASALRRLHRPLDALHTYDEALKLTDQDSDIWNGRGQVLLDLGRNDEARDSFAHAVALGPDNAGFHNNLAVALRLTGALPEALSEVETALALEERSDRTHLCHGQILAALNQPEAAITAFDRATEIEPYNGEAWAERGRVLLHLGRTNEAAGSFGHALAITPADGQSWCNHGTCWVQQNRTAEARYDFNMALICDPQNVEIQWNAALCELALGRFETGWPLYEARLNRPPVDQLVRRFTAPRWCGAGDISGKRLLVYAEQGAGDVIQFCRYIPALAAHSGAQIILMVHAPLICLMHNLPGVAQLVPLPQTPPEHDLQCPVMSLPLAFARAGWAEPEAIPYLTTPENPAEDATDGDVPRIGLVVSGAPAHANDANRSAPLVALAPVLKLPGDFTLLQPKIRETDRAFAESCPRLNLPLRALSDYGKTAAMIAGLDLVITVDTSVAHLAGAMGKAVWLMLPWCAEWRWGEAGESCRWYPTMRIFRQSEAGNWSGLAEDLAEQLKKNIFPSRSLC